MSFVPWYNKNERGAHDTIVPDASWSSLHPASPPGLDRRGLRRSLRDPQHHGTGLLLGHPRPRGLRPGGAAHRALALGLVRGQHVGYVHEAGLEADRPLLAALMGGLAAVAALSYENIESNWDKKGVWNL